MSLGVVVETCCPNKPCCSRTQSFSRDNIPSEIAATDPITRWEKSASRTHLPPNSLSERLLDLAFEDETVRTVSCMAGAAFNAYIMLLGVQAYELIMIVMGFFATLLFGLLLKIYFQSDQDTASDDSKVFHETDHQLMDSDTLLRKTSNDETCEMYQNDADYENGGQCEYFNYEDHDMRRNLSQLSFSSSTASTQDFD